VETPRWTCTLSTAPTKSPQFEKYTPEQLAWCQSAEAEELRLLANDLEEAKEE
jgi:hypothetical protein